jgi:hypothetical protein
VEFAPWKAHLALTIMWLFLQMMRKKILRDCTHYTRGATVLMSHGPTLLYASLVWPKHSAMTRRLDVKKMAIWVVVGVSGCLWKINNTQVNGVVYKYELENFHEYLWSFTFCFDFSLAQLRIFLEIFHLLRFTFHTRKSFSVEIFHLISGEKFENISSAMTQ